MARRRRPGSRTSVTDGRAELIVPIEAITTADGEPLPFKAAGRWFSRVSTHPAELTDAPPAVALVVDGFAFDLHVGDIAFATDTHDGEVFRDLAAEVGADVYVVSDIDPRRSSATDLEDAAMSGRLLGARVAGFVVDRLAE